MDGQMEKLDRNILDWIAQKADNEALTAQILSAKQVKRDYMRTGFFVYFAVDEDLPLLDNGLRLRSPDILSAELMDGGGTTLFLRNGRLHYLEIYARGGFFPEHLDDYQLASAS